MKANEYAHINQTESIRIAGELNRWIGGGKTLNWTYDAPRRKRKVYLNEEKINGKMFCTYWYWTPNYGEREKIRSAFVNPVVYKKNYQF